MITNITQQDVLIALEGAGRTLWIYLRYLIIGSLIIFAAKNYAMNILTRLKLLFSQERCTRPDDEVVKKEKRYRIEYIEWLGGKIKFINTDDPTDEILQETQDYWKNIIAIVNNRKKSRRKTDK